MADGLTADDVFAACDALLRKGVAMEKITGHAAWSRLGRGSKSTVQKHWKEWRVKQDSSAPLTRNAAVNTIQETIDRLVDQAVTDERLRAETAIAQLEEEIRQLGRGLASALAEAEQVASQLDEVTAKSTVEAAQRQRAEAERDWLKSQLAERDEELADALAGRRNHEREIEKAAGRLARSLPPQS